MRKIIIVLLVLVLCNFTGCTSFLSRDSRELEPQNLQMRTLTIDPDPQPREVDIKLYFKHELADFLVPEYRKVQKGKESLEQLVVEELLKGPKKPGRCLVMPPGVSVIDVIRSGELVFVNLSKEFQNDIDLAALPGKENIPDEEKPKVLAEMKKLAIYSIVNSLTEIDGIKKVKILVDNRQLSYKEMGIAEMDTDFASTDANLPVVAFTRSKKYNLTPAKTVEFVLGRLTGEPRWEEIYFFLASKTASGSKLPPLDELKAVMDTVGIALEIDENPVDEEEITGDGTAFVTVHYTIKYPSGKKQTVKKDFLNVVNEEGIWKVKLPAFLEQVK